MGTFGREDIPRQREGSSAKKLREVDTEAALWGEQLRVQRVLAWERPGLGETQ